MRGEEQVFKGKLGSLKRFKDDAREVTNRRPECGIGLGGFNDLKEGDLIEAFSTEKLDRRSRRTHLGKGGKAIDRITP